MNLRAMSIAIAVVLVAGCANSASPGAPTAAPSTPAVASASPAPTLSPAATPTATLDLEARLDRMLATGFDGSVLVAKDGKVLYAKGFGMADEAAKLANTPETRFRIGSLTKQFTAMGILILEARGLVKSSDPICDYLGTCPNGWNAITVAHLLDHTSGIADFTEQADFEPMKAATPAQTVASVSDIPLTGTPGTSFSYTNTGYVLLGMVIEDLSATSYQAFLQDEIFGPLGMKDSGYEDGDTPGLATGYAFGSTVAEPLDMSVPYAAGGIYSTVLDLELWEEALYTDTLAPAAEMARYFTALTASTDRAGFGYGYGQYVGDDGGSKLVSHDGGINGFISQLSRYPDEHITVALLTNREQSPDLGSMAKSIAKHVRETP